MANVFVDVHQRLAANLATGAATADQIESTLVWSRAVDGTLLIANTALRRRVGLSFEGLARMDFWRISHSDDRLDNHFARWVLTKRHERVTSISRLWDADRRRYSPVFYCAAPILRLDRKLAGFIVAAVRLEQRELLDADSVFYAVLGLDRRRADLPPRLRPSSQLRRREDATQVISLIERWERRKASAPQNDTATDK